MSELDDLTGTLMCLRCYGLPGRPCTDPSGRVLPRFHAARRAPLLEAYQRGRRAAQQGGSERTGSSS